MAYPEVGTLFPDFALENQAQETVTLDSLKGRKAVIYFYPKDDTPGCTAQACGMRDAMPSFGDAQIYGVSPDAPTSHEKFITKFDLNFPLLADEDHALAEAAGVWVEKSMYGKKYMGVERTTFVLDEDGKVLAVFPKVKPAEHADKVRKALAS